MPRRGNPDYVLQGTADSRKEKAWRVGPRKLSHAPATTHPDSSTSLAGQEERHVGQLMTVPREGPAAREGSGSSSSDGSAEDQGEWDQGTETAWSAFLHVTGLRTRNLASTSMHADITFTR